jgi:hypothetical protein
MKEYTEKFKKFSDEFNDLFYSITIRDHELYFQGDYSKESERILLQNGFTYSRTIEYEGNTRKEFKREGENISANLFLN